MTSEERLQLIADVQKRQSQLANLAVKAARSDTPRRLYESLPALAYCTGVGMLSFELAELKDFSIMGTDSVHSLLLVYFWKTTP